MPSHLSTPASVLNAPRLTPRLLVAQPGVPRRLRRHGVLLANGMIALPPNGKRIFVSKDRQPRASNRPYVRAVEPAARETGRPRRVLLRSIIARSGTALRGVL